VIQVLASIAAGRRWLGVRIVRDGMKVAKHGFQRFSTRITMEVGGILILEFGSGS
jgi:hypothetical protein